MVEFEGEVLRNRNEYEIINEYGDGFTEINGILEQFRNKKIHIEIEEII